MISLHEAIELSVEKLDPPTVEVKSQFPRVEAADVWVAELVEAILVPY